MKKIRNPASLTIFGIIIAIIISFLVYSLSISSMALAGAAFVIFAVVAIIMRNIIAVSVFSFALIFIFYFIALHDGAFSIIVSSIASIIIIIFAVYEFS